MQSGDKNATLSDFILIDPDPITEEEATRREYERKQIEIKANKQRLINMFDSLVQDDN